MLSGVCAGLANFFGLDVSLVRIVYTFATDLYCFCRCTYIHYIIDYHTRRIQIDIIEMIKVGIIGGAGYTAGELIRLLLNHPEAEIVFINSSSNAGNKITDVHEGLYGETDLVFTDQLPLEEIDVLFFCTAHGDTREVPRKPQRARGTENHRPLHGLPHSLS